MFRSLLIANRGEIAVRIMHTAKTLGLRTIAVYSDADAHAWHVEAADEAIRIGPAPARESYLRIDAILDAAQQTGAEAIHPGYGFLSENPEFAQACADAGIIFVGPPPAAIRAMGLKDRAKALMAEAGVAVVPGYLGDDQSLATLTREADKIGYPVLIKAVAGGGGKGMRRVDSAAEFANALEGAKREAKSSFNDDRVLIEKYVTRPRHIEVQVFADSFGKAVHLFERDCSLQRRHQKVVEEAPAPGMPVDMREAMGAAAVKAVKAVGYVGAGTIEFIVDASEGLKSDRFWFMEMNTRLQVEHRVTEAITGLDLVEWQLRVAAGERLPRLQDEIRMHGHAVEARLYAEDPNNGFLPATGTLERLSLFSSSAKCDSGVRDGDVVTPYYDPMIAKVYSYGQTREAAIDKLAKALEAAAIVGVRTNNAFLIRCLRHPDFVSGEVDTSFIPQRIEELLPETAIPQRVLEAASGIFLEGGSRPADPWTRRDTFRVGGVSNQIVSFSVDGKRVDVSPVPRHWSAALLQVQKMRNGDIAVTEKGQTFVVHPYDPFEAADASGSSSDRVVTPMPGKIIQILVKAGETVKRGQPLATLEAMKMEHTLSAPADAVVASVEAKAGEQVSDGAVIVRFEKAA